MIKYVCGFLFNTEEQVCLVQKLKPEWMKGLWNGVGGKIEPGETEIEAMRREFTEETGYTNPLTWVHFATLNGIEVAARDGNNQPYQVYFFWAYCPTKNLVYDSGKHIDNKEPVDWFSEEALPNTMLNLTWLIPMALNLPAYDSPMWLEEPEFQKERLKCLRENIEQSVLD